MGATLRGFRPTLAAAATFCAVLGVVSSAQAGACGPGMGTDQTIGTLAGAAAGGLIGNQFGKGSGKDVATVAGVVAGGVMGNQAGEAMDASNCAPPPAQPAYVPAPPPPPVAVAPAPVYQAPPAAAVYQAPPPVVAYAPPPPRAGFVWVSGFWQWDGRRYLWREGYWERERPGYAYVPAAWVLVGGGWRLTPGHWVEARYDRHGPPHCPPGLAKQGRC